MTDSMISLKVASSSLSVVLAFGAQGEARPGRRLGLSLLGPAVGFNVWFY